MKDRVRALLILLPILLLLAAQDTPPPFEAEPYHEWAYDGPAEGVIFARVGGPQGLIVERQGTDKIIGQAWGDYDNDGWLDLYVTDSAGPNVLLRNTQDGRFEPAPVSSMVALSGRKSSGAVFADFDNDGWQDLYVLNDGEPNALFRNMGGNAFRNMTATAGVGDSGHGRTASWGDYDSDGWLDLYVANWSCSPDCGHPTSGDRDRLYHNNGDGTFRDVTGLLGAKVSGAGFVASFVDYDGDGDQDIYLVNDEFVNPVGNALWRNDGAGCDGWCFREVSALTGADEHVMGMGLATGDYDNDGDLDFYFTNVGPMVLLENIPDSNFNNVANLAGVTGGGTAIGWGAVFADFDNDGWQDLYLAVSDITPDGEPHNPLFLNNGDGSFELFFDGHAPGRTLGVAYADYDNDGWVDLVTGNFDEGYTLYRNVGAGNSDYGRITMRLVGGGAVNRDAIGARVTLTTGDGQTQTQEVQAGASLGAGNAAWLYFGLGTGEIDQVTIRWPDGLLQTFDGLAANRRYTFRYPLS